MFPSNNNFNITNNNSNNDLLLSFTDHQCSTFFDPFLQFPSPYPYDQLELENNLDFLLSLQQTEDLCPDQIPINPHQNTTSMASETVTNDSPKKATPSQSPMKNRSSKKDRHSKINTAKGPRDRRMRLSLEIAKKFFGLQDMLGYDKASKTVEWLLVQARKEIKKLVDANASHPQASNFSPISSTNSECEVVSGLVEESNIEVDIDEVKVSKKMSNLSKDKKSRRKQPRKSIPYVIPKDLRKAARERAKERTENRRRKCKEGTINDDINKFDKMGEESHNIGSWSLEEVENPRSMEQVDNHLVSMNKWSPFFSIFNYQQTTNGIVQENQFTDFELFGKPWEGYCNQNLR